MVENKKIRKKAQVALEKAELLMDNERLKKASEYFEKSGDFYTELDEWKVAEQCYFYTSKNYHKLGGDKNFHRASLAEQKAANCCVMFSNFTKARDYFDIAAKSILKAMPKHAFEIATMNFSMAFLCYFTRAKLADGILYVKKFKNEIDSENFHHHPAMLIVRNITKAIQNHDEKYLDILIDNFHHYHFEKGEMLLLREAIIIGLAELMTKLILPEADQEYKRETMRVLHTELDLSRLNEFENYTIVPKKFQSLSITNIEVPHSENLGLKERPKLPFKLPSNNFGKIPLEFKLRNNIQGPAFIGPITLTIEIDGKYKFLLQSPKQDYTVISPEAQLLIELDPQKTPVINQTFPVQVKITNKGEGNAMDIGLKFEFTDDMKLMRGTYEKTIYALSPNEKMTWNIMVKASDVGDIPIKITTAYKDGDGNDQGPFETEIPLTINL
ncbi:MAG: hypothetical protein ACTSVU_10245 [Promethearchaeota archaeon]